MSAERQKGITYSAALHVLWLLFAIFGIPSLLTRDRIEEPAAITVELLPISTISNVKPSEKQAPEEKKDDPKDQSKPAPPVKSSEAPPPPPKETPAEKKKEPEKKPEEKPKEEKKKPKEEDLAAVLKAVKDTAQKEKKKTEKEKDKDSGGKSISNQYDPTLPMSISEKDAIRSQISKCWSVPAGAKDAHELIVVLRIELAKDGSVIQVELARESKGRYSSDSFFRAAADSAMRAVRQCSPIKNLPPEKYGTWRDMELTFDPKEMLF